MFSTAMFFAFFSNIFAVGKSSASFTYINPPVPPGPDPTPTPQGDVTASDVLSGSLFTGDSNIFMLIALFVLLATCIVASIFAYKKLKSNNLSLTAGHAISLSNTKVTAIVVCVVIALLLSGILCAFGNNKAIANVNESDVANADKNEKTIESTCEEGTVTAEGKVEIVETIKNTSTEADAVIYLSSVGVKNALEDFVDDWTVVTSGGNTLNYGNSQTTIVDPIEEDVWTNGVPEGHENDYYLIQEPILPGDSIQLTWTANVDPARAQELDGSGKVEFYHTYTDPATWASEVANKVEQKNYNVAYADEVATSLFSAAADLQENIEIQDEAINAEQDIVSPIDIEDNEGLFDSDSLSSNEQISTEDKDSSNLLANNNTVKNTQNEETYTTFSGTQASTELYDWTTEVTTEGTYKGQLTLKKEDLTSLGSFYFENGVVSEATIICNGNHIISGQCNEIIVNNSFAIYSRDCKISIKSDNHSSVTVNTTANSKYAYGICSTYLTLDNVDLNVNLTPYKQFPEGWNMVYSSALDIGILKLTQANLSIVTLDSVDDLINNKISSNYGLSANHSGGSGGCAVVALEDSTINSLTGFGTYSGAVKINLNDEAESVEKSIVKNSTINGTSGNAVYSSIGISIACAFEDSFTIENSSINGTSGNVNFELFDTSQYLSPDSSGIYMWQPTIADCKLVVDSDSSMTGTSGNVISKLDKATTEDVPNTYKQSSTGIKWYTRMRINLTNDGLITGEAGNVSSYKVVIEDEGKTYELELAGTSIGFYPVGTVINNGTINASAGKASRARGIKMDSTTTSSQGFVNCGTVNCHSGSDYYENQSYFDFYAPIATGVDTSKQKICFDGKLDIQKGNVNCYVDDNASYSMPIFSMVNSEESISYNPITIAQGALQIYYPQGKCSLLSHINDFFMNASVEKSFLLHGHNAFLFNDTTEFNITNIWENYMPGFLDIDAESAEMLSPKDFLFVKDNTKPVIITAKE